MANVQEQNHNGKKMLSVFYGIVLIGLVLALILSVLLSITFGNANITNNDVYRVVIAEIFHVDSMKTYSDAIHDVVWLIRFPRALLALAVGIRMIFGTDHRKLIPLCALTGAIFLIWCDVACRVILPHSELPIGILVSIIGAPCFIYLMVRRSYGFGGGRA